MPAELRQLLSPEEASAMLGVSRRTLALWDRAGKLPADLRTIGGHRRWFRETLERFLQEQIRAERGPCSALDPANLFVCTRHAGHEGAHNWPAGVA